MRKTLLTLFVLAAASCGEQPSPTVKFSRPIGDPDAPPKRSLLLGLDDPEHRFWFDQIAVAGNYLYFTMPWQGAYRMPKYGGDVYPIEEAHGVEDFRGMATNGTEVFWAKQSAFGSVGDDFGYTRLRGQSLAGGPLRTVAEGGFAIQNAVIASMAFSAGPDAVYGPVTYPRQDFYDLTRFPVDGSAPSAPLFRFDLALSASPASYLTEMVTDQDFGYITECGSDYVTCTLIRINLRIPGRETLATFAEGETIAAVDATYLYLTGGNRLLRLPKQGGGQPVILANFEGQNHFGTHVVVDESNIFLAGGRILWSVPKEGGVPRAMATDFVFTADQLAQDESNIFVLHGLESIDIVPKTASVPIP